MKRQILQAFLHLLPFGMEVHPTKIMLTILKIEPNIETKKLNSLDMHRIKEKFRELIVQREECNITQQGDYYE